MGWDFLEVMVVIPIPISPNWHVQSVKELRDGTERFRVQSYVLEGFWLCSVGINLKDKLVCGKESLTVTC